MRVLCNLRTSPLLLDRRTGGIQTDWRADSFKIIGGYLDGRRSEYSTKFYEGWLRPEVQPLTHFFIPSLTDKVPL